MAFIIVTSGGRAPKRIDDESNHRHRQLIGYIGLVLPMLLIFLAIYWDGLDVWRQLDSVSAYYYTGANPAFVGMLVVLALFLFTYDGYKNESQWADRWFSNAAAVAALGVAFFPTAAPKIDGISALRWWEPWVGVVHFTSAAVLFGIFALFCLWLFRKKAKQEADSDKRNRNAVYVICGTVIIVCIFWAGYEGLRDRSIFWPESIALIFFAISWLVKGYAMRSVADVARSWLTPKASALDEEDMSKR
jgi:amino acid transporter